MFCGQKAAIGAANEALAANTCTVRIMAQGVQLHGLCVFAWKYYQVSWCPETECMAAYQMLRHCSTLALTGMLYNQAGGMYGVRSAT